MVNYTVIIDVHNPDLKLLPGLTANINIKVREHHDILKVPVNALHFTPPPAYFKYAESLPDSVKKKILVTINAEKKYVWVKHERYLQPVEVTSRLTDGSFTEVEGALKKGDEVVVAAESAGQTAEINRSPFMPSFNRPPRGVH